MARLPSAWVPMRLLSIPNSMVPWLLAAILCDPCAYSVVFYFNLGEVNVCESIEAKTVDSVRLVVPARTSVGVLAFSLLEHVCCVHFFHNKKRFVQFHRERRLESLRPYYLMMLAVYTSFTIHLAKQYPRTLRRT